MNYAAILQGILQEELAGKPPLQNVRLDLPSLKTFVASCTGVLYGLVEEIMAGSVAPQSGVGWQQACTDINNNQGEMGSLGRRLGASHKVN